MMNQTFLLKKKQNISHCIQTFLCKYNFEGKHIEIGLFLIYMYTIFCSSIDSRDFEKHRDFRGKSL